MTPHRFTTRLATGTAAALLLVGTTAAGATSPAADAPPAGPVPSTAIPGQIAITWSPDASAAERATVRDRHGLATEERFREVDIEIVQVPTAEAKAVAASLAEEPAVELAELDHLVEGATNDPWYSQQWSLQNGADVDIDAPEAWGTTQGSGQVVVAVLDTGIDISHPDLAPNIWRNPGETPGNGVDDDRNGYVDDVNGWDFVNNDGTVYDGPSEDLHGTHVAGTIAGLAGNGIGIAGVAPKVRIMPVKVLGGADGSGSTAAAAAGVAYARAMGATVVNASWGGGSSQTLRTAIANAPGTLVVAAAGNAGTDVDVSSPQFPAAWAAEMYRLPNVLSVAAVDRNGGLASFSNHGDDTIDVGAPGESILSTTPGANYASASGTSMATPHASGVAALAASVAPSLRGGALADVVKSSGASLRSLQGRTTTGRMVNAAAAVSAPAPVSSTPTTTAPAPTTTTTAPTTPPTTQPVEAPDAESGVRTLDNACPDVTTSGFVDVPTGSVHAPGVGCARQWGVFTGTAGSTFGPTATLTRAQLASVLVRAIEEATGASLTVRSSGFSDVVGSVHQQAIDKLAALGVVTGTGPGTYEPSTPVSRGQFATMLARTHQHLTGDRPAGPDAFVDDDGSTHEPAIDALAALGIVGGTADGRYLPGAELTRAQSATLVSRLLDALVELGVASRPTG